MPQSAEELFYMFPKGKYPLSPDELEQVAQTRKSPTVVTAAGGEVAAYCTLYDVVEGESAWLGNVIVHPNYRRAGVGSFLVTAMKQVARSDYRAAALHLVCHNTNTGALQFYYRQGFRPYDMIAMADYQANEVVGILMSSRLWGSE